MSTIPFFARRLIRPRRTLFYLLLLLASSGLALIFRWSSHGEQLTGRELVELFRDDLGPFLLGAVGVLVPLLYATNAFASELEEHTIITLVTRPRRRGLVLLEKYLAVVLVCLPLMVLAIALPALIMLPAGELSTRVLGSYCAIAALAGLAYSSAFFFIGLALRRPMLWGAAVAIGWEGFLGTLPGNLQSFTVQNQVARFLAASCGQRSWSFGLPIEEGSAALAAPLITLGVVSALFLIFAYGHFRAKQIS